MSAIRAKGDRWLARRYGSRRGFMRTYWYKFRYYLGAYRQYKHIDWQCVDRLVFVCKGNICRSVFAEAVAQSLGVDATSCGLDTIEGAPANADAIRAADRNGFDLGKHKTQPVMYAELKRTDLIIAMEPWQAEYLEKNLARKHVFTLLGLWGMTPLPHIQDPYSSSGEYFDKCFSIININVQALVKEISQ